MVNIKLNEHTAEDVKCIQELQAMGIPDEIIQKYYDMVYPSDLDAKMDTEPDRSCFNCANDGLDVPQCKECAGNDFRWFREKV